MGLVLMGLLHGLLEIGDGNSKRGDFFLRSGLEDDDEKKQGFLLQNFPGKLFCLGDCLTEVIVVTVGGCFLLLSCKWVFGEALLS